jgi:hypothetical protein
MVLLKEYDNDIQIWFETIIKIFEIKKIFFYIINQFTI